LKLKKKIVHFTGKREKRKKETIFDDNLTTIHHHTPHHMEKDTVAHPKR
jgi:hypothetical protein